MPGELIAVKVFQKAKAFTYQSGPKAGANGTMISNDVIVVHRLDEFALRLTHMEVPAFTAPSAA